VKPAERYFYSTSREKPEVIDKVFEREDGTLHGLWTGESWEDLAKKNGNCLVGDCESVIKLVEAAHYCAPEKITEERFFEALECMPPSKWRTVSGIESFHLCELYTGSVASFFARAGDRYFTFREHKDIPVEMLNEAVNKAVAALEASAEVQHG
jgi:hypothetical protein